MPTREKIREGLTVRLNWDTMENKKLCDIVDDVLAYLHSQGVVIKNKIDIPDEGLWMPGGWYIPKAACDALMRLAVEPLIEDT